MAKQADETAPSLSISEAWRATYPKSHAGLLVMADAANPPRSEALEQRKADLEAELRHRFEGQDRAALLTNPTLKAYAAYYRGFDKTYHVQLQLESILLKGKSIPSSASLVEAMFMAELETLLLTAGHDLDDVRGGLVLDAAEGTESYLSMRGTPQATKAGDMMIRDSEGILSSILYGPAQRAQITPGTTRVAFTVYAPDGIESGEVERQLEILRTNVQTISPRASVMRLQVYGAGQELTE